MCYSLGTEHEVSNEPDINDVLYNFPPEFFLSTLFLQESWEIGKLKHGETASVLIV